MGMRQVGAASGRMGVIRAIASIIMGVCGIIRRGPMLVGIIRKASIHG